MTKIDLALFSQLDEASISQALAVLRRESDRGAVLVAIAILDEVFEARIKQLLRFGNSDVRARLLKSPTGPLATFSSKVDLAYCIGLTPKFVYEDIKLLNRLRNRCAHDWNDFRITTEIVDEYVQPMAVKHILDAANEVGQLVFPPGCAPKVILVRTLAALVTLANLHKPTERA